MSFYFEMFALTFVASLVGWSLYCDFFVKARADVERRVDEKLTMKIRHEIKSRDLFRDRSLFADLSSRSSRLVEVLRDFLEQSGVAISLQQFFGLSAMAGLTSGLVIFAVTGHWYLALGASLLGGVLPHRVVAVLVRRRKQRLLAQLPGAFDLIGRTVRSGSTFWRGVSTVGQEFDAPAGVEFAYAYEMQNLGISTETALREFARRSGLVEGRFLAETVAIQQQCGGDLGEVLDKLTHVIRERFRIQGKIGTLTAEGRMQAWVLAAIAPLLTAVIAVLNPEYGNDLFRWNGGALLMVMAAGDFLGWFWIQRIVSFDY
ncbi:MAG: type II secretion system F family protein [Planctomycetaceae bacterium]